MALIDSYSESNQNSRFNVGGTSTGVKKVGQKFTPGDNYDLTSCKFYLAKLGGDTSGNIVATVYNISNGVPTGSPIATSNTVDSTTLGTQTYSLIEFTFSSGTINSGTEYAVCIEFSGGTSTNVVWFGNDNSSPTHSGEIVYYNLGGSGAWENNSGIDSCFYVYGTVAVSGPANLKSVNGLAKASIKSIKGLAIGSVKKYNGLN